MAQAGSLYTSLSLESSSFVSGLKKATEATASSAASIEKSLNQIKGVGIAAFGSAIASQILQLGKAGLEYASSLDEVSQQLGVTARDLQVYRYAASQVGISNEEMDGALQKFTKTLGAARAGNATAVDTFRELGVSMVDIKKGDPHDVFLKMADGIAQLKDRTSRSTPEIAILGKTGQQLDPMLSQGSKGINALAKAAEDLGIVLSHDQIENADAAADKLSELKQVLEANIAKFVADNAQAIFGFAEAIENLAVKAADFVKDAKANFAGLGSLFEPLAVGGEHAFDRLGIRITSFHDQLVSILQGIDTLRNVPLDVANGFASRVNAQVNGITGKLGLGTGHNLPASVVGTAGVARSDLAGRFDKGYRAAVAASAASAAGGGANDNGGGGHGYTDPAAAAAAAAKAKEAAAKAEAARQKALRQQEAGDNAIAQANNETLTLRGQLTADVREQARLAHEQVTLDGKARDHKLDQDVAEGQITATASIELKNRGALNDELKNAQINRELDAKLDQQDLDSRLASLGDRRDILSAQADLADTTAERRDIELKLLDLQFEEERARQEAVIASRDATEADKTIARNRLAALPQLQSLGRDKVNQQNASPLQAYHQSIIASTKDMNAALEGVEVNGLKGLSDGLTGLISGTESVASAFGKMAESIISDLARIAIEKAVIGPLLNALAGGAGSLLGGTSSLLGGVSSGALGGGWGTDLGKVSSLDLAPLHFADTGSFKVGGSGGPDSKLFSMALTPGEAVEVSHGDGGRRGNMTIHQTIQFQGGVDLATRTEVYKVANATHQATMAALEDKKRRAG